MLDPIKRSIHLLNSFEDTAHSIRNGNAKSVFFSRQHFPKFLGACMLASGIAGYCTMSMLTKQRVKRLDDNYKLAWERHPETGKLTSRNEAMVMAMVENARSSTVKENLENVSSAQDRFMHGSKGGNPAFLQRVMTRANELVHERTDGKQKL